MQLTQKVYRRAALAALAALGILLPGAGAEAQTNYRRQQYNSMAGYQQPTRLAQSQAPPAPVPVTQPTPADDSSQSPFADDPDSGMAGLRLRRGICGNRHRACQLATATAATIASSRPCAARSAAAAGTAARTICWASRISARAMRRSSARRRPTPASRRTFPT